MMHLPLALQSTRRAQRRRRRRPPRVLYPRLIEARYQRELVRLVNTAREFVREQLTPRIAELLRDAGFTTDALRADDYSETIGRILEGVRIEFERRISDEDITAIASGTARQLDLFNKRQVNRQIKSVLGIDIFQSEPWLVAATNAFTRENVSLINSIPNRYFEEIETLVLRNVRGGRRAPEIAAEIQQRYSVSKKRAAFIAKDQVGKLNADLTRGRQGDLGLNRYRWRTSRDERVRGNPAGHYPKVKHSHWTREGKIYSYDNPPEDGNPGKPPGCRCWAEPVIEDILGDEFGMDLTLAPAATASAPRAKRSRLRRGVR